MKAAVSKKVLIVEDDSDIRQLVKLYLDNEGCRTMTAVNGTEALTSVKVEHPDLVVLDLMLPEWTAWKCARDFEVPIKLPCFRSSC